MYSYYKKYVSRVLLDMRESGEDGKRMEELQYITFMDNTLEYQRREIGLPAEASTVIIDVHAGLTQAELRANLNMDLEDDEDMASNIVDSEDDELLADLSNADQLLGNARR
jgi:hypothetical protein